MRRSLILIAVMSLVFASACGADGFDPEGFQDMVDVLEQMEDDTSNPGDDSSDPEDDSSDPDNPGANTSSPNRPPRPDGGIREGSDYNEERRQSYEDFVYAPLDQPYEDVVDYYEDHFEGEGETGQLHGYETTIFGADKQTVVVLNEGTATRVQTWYND